MAKNMQPIAKRCRALGISPAVMGYSKKTSNRNPGGKMRRKKSEYSMQLTEKQKVKFIYGILEKQFHAYYEKAEKAEGKTGEELLSLVERRLDNVVFRLGLAATRREARQLVNHAHFTVNGKKVNIPSYLVKVGDVIAVKEKQAAPPPDSRRLQRAKTLLWSLPSGSRRTQTSSAARSLPFRREMTLTIPLKSTSSSSCTPSNHTIIFTGRLQTQSCRYAAA